MYGLCLINPPSPGLVHPNAQAPLGLLYVAAAARAAGYSVCVHDMNTDPEFVPLHLAVYGITGYHTQVAVVNALARHLKRLNRDCRVVVGGPIWLSAGELDHGVIDQTFSVAGELVIPQIMGEPDAPGSWPLIVEDLDALPLPARDLWPGSLGGPTFARGKVYFQGGSTGMLASRGCPNACAFCANPRLTGCKRRTRDPGLVAAEMLWVVVDYGIREFTFWDEYFNADAAHVLALCEAIGESITLSADGIAWRATVAAKPSIPRVWKAMRNAGCREVSIGIESGDADVLRAMHKRATVADNTRAVREAHAAGLNVRALMMIGTPGQTRETLQRDIAWVCENREYLDLVAVTVFVPMPGSAIYEHPEKFGCELRDLEDKSIASYRPDGLLKVEPHIDIEGMDRDTLRRHMQVFLDFLDTTEGLHRG